MGSVLIVEDHEDTAWVTERLLRRAGFRVARAATCAQARAFAAADTFDLLLCDLGLSDGDGCQLLAELRGRYGIDGLAYSGYGMPDDLARSRAAGFLGHLVKPVPLERLTAAVTDAIASRRRRHAPPAGGKAEGEA